MKRIFTVLAVAALMAAMMVVSAMPVFAQGKGALVGKDPGDKGPPDLVLTPSQGGPNGAFVFDPGAQETCVVHFQLPPESQGQQPEETGPGCNPGPE
jgi:hypothetical protein